MPDFDIGIVGLGAMGSASTDALAMRGAKVVAFDQHEPPHSLGSTHGHTRIIREAYYEHPLYVPLVRRAYERWNDLEQFAGETLLVPTGGVMAGPEAGPLFSGALASARTHSIPHELLTATELRARYPAFAPRDDWFALVEKRAGFLRPERCVAAMLARARSNGAAIHTGVRVQKWKRSGNAISVVTDASTVVVDRLIVAAGPWLPSLLESAGVAIPLEIERQLSHWFEPRMDRGHFAPATCPIALWEMPGGDVFATFPNDGNGVKCGMHHAGAPTTPDFVSRTVTDAETSTARGLLEQVMPGAGGAFREARVCLYTNTPDRHFLIDWIADGRVLILSPCSGHGFKFASAVGEIAAQLALAEKSWLDLAPFSLRRFSGL
jgi:sarcosine oxidase